MMGPPQSKTVRVPSISPAPHTGQFDDAPGRHRCGEWAAFKHLVWHRMPTARAGPCQSSGIPTNPCDFVSPQRCPPLPPFQWRWPARWWPAAPRADHAAHPDTGSHGVRAKSQVTAADPRPGRPGLGGAIGGRAGAGSGHPAQTPVPGGLGGPRGEVLFQIDPKPYQAALDAALASLAQAQATAINAAVNAKRTRDLLPSGLVSRSDVDNNNATERSSQAQVKQAEANVETRAHQPGIRHRDGADLRSLRPAACHRRRTGRARARRPCSPPSIRSTACT